MYRCLKVSQCYLINSNISGIGALYHMQLDKLRGFLGYLKNQQENMTSNSNTLIDKDIDLLKNTQIPRLKLYIFSCWCYWLESEPPFYQYYYYIAALKSSRVEHKMSPSSVAEFIAKSRIKQGSFLSCLLSLHSSSRLSWS